MKNTNIKIEETMRSIEGIQSAKVPHYIYDNLRARIAENLEEKKISHQLLVSDNYLLRVACVFVGLVFFNVLILKKSEQTIEQVSVKPYTANIVADNYYSPIGYNY